MNRIKTRKKIIVTTLVFVLIATIIPMSGQAGKIKKELEIHAPAVVNEGESFVVYVTERGSNITLNDVKITWLGQIYYTNETVYLTAPEVNHTRIEMIYAEKEGFLPAKKPVTILDVPEQPRLILTAPTYVWGGDMFSVFVTDNLYRPITGALVTFYVPLGGGQNGSGNETDYIEIHYTINGSAVFTAPFVDEPIIGSISAVKDGYLPDSATIQISKRPDELRISAPSFVMEGEFFCVYVSDYQGFVDDALVTLTVFNGHNYTYSTYSENGVAWLLAPMVDASVYGLIIAEKEGYLSAQTWILIQDNEPELQLQINAPKTVPEGKDFKVIVTANNEPVMNATIYFLNGSYSTNEDGVAVLTAPFVNEDLKTMLYAFKEGFIPGEAWITILNKK